MGPDFPQGHDATAHLTHMYRFDRAFEQGQIPVRWVEGIRDGVGQPLFNFYQVGFYYAVELPHQLGMPLSSAFRATPVFLWWLAALFSWLWLRPLGLAAATAGSLSFALSPYLIVDVFVRAAYPEFAAIAFAVGTIWASDAFLRTGGRWYFALTSVLVALTLLSHLPATLIASPAVAAAIGTSVAFDGTRRTRLRPLLGAAALGVGLASFYVMPALLEISLVKIRGLTTKWFDFHQHFVPASLWTRYVWSYEWNYGGSSVTKPDDLMPLRVGPFQWVALVGATAIVGWAVVRRTWSPRATASAAWLVVAALSLFMMHARSVAVWEAIGPLAFIQFPWRFFLLTSIACSALLALLVSAVRTPRARTIVLLAIVAGLLHLYPRRLHPATRLSAAEMNIDNAAWAQTADAKRLGHDEPSYDPSGSERGPAVDRRWTISDGRAAVHALRTDDARLTLRVTAEEPSIFRLHMRMFPGWRIQLDDAPAAVTRVPVDGYMALTVPPGTHVVDARFDNTPVRTTANAVTLMSALTLAIVVLRRRSGAAVSEAERRRAA
ncbi:MAG: hypothetical protein AB7J63_09230 [Vicinamibacterales bacterium]